MGTVAVGGDCFFSEECVSGAACLAASGRSSGQCCAGVCQTPKVTMQLGGDCSTSNQSCRRNRLRLRRRVGRQNLSEAGRCRRDLHQLQRLRGRSLL